MGIIISVIVPVYNDSRGLKDTLESLVNQNSPPENFEIIVADNGSTDNTLDVAKAFTQKYPKLIRFVVEDKTQSSYAARNMGIKNARGSIIAFIDADMSVDEDWLTGISDSLKEHQADYLACNVEIYTKGKSIFGLYNKMTGFPVEDYVRNLHFAPTCCLVVRKIVFENAGLFDSRLISSGDKEFGTRVYKSGYKIYYEPNIVMKHPARSSLKQLFSKSFRIGRGAQQLSSYHPERYKIMPRNISGPFHYLLSMIRNFLRIIEENEIWNKSSFGTRIGFFKIYMAGQIAHKAGYVYEGKEEKKNRNTTGDY